MSKDPLMPIARPYLGKRELRYIEKALRSGWVTQGEWVSRLEKKFASFTGCRYAVAANSCTSTQLMAARSIGLGKGDEAIIPAFTWISTANSVEFYGAKPVFVDIDLETFNLDVSKLEGRISRITKAIMPVHLFGYPAYMPEILQMAKKYRLKVIEDCACSLGAFIKGKHTGSFGDCGCFSLHPRKSITTGEGGVLVTNNSGIASMAEALRSHGADLSDLSRHKKRGSFLLPRYPITGFNFRMTDIQGAMGSAQFERLPVILKKKKNIASYYLESLAGVRHLGLPSQPEKGIHGWQAFVCMLGPEGIASKSRETIDHWHRRRNSIMRSLEIKGIATRQGTHAVHIQKYYRDKYRYEPMDFPKAYAADRLSLALPMYHQMTRKDQDYVISNLLAELGKEI